MIIGDKQETSDFFSKNKSITLNFGLKESNNILKRNSKFIMEGIEEHKNEE